MGLSVLENRPKIGMNELASLSSASWRGVGIYIVCNSFFNQAFNNEGVLETCADGIAGGRSVSSDRAERLCGNSLGVSSPLGVTFVSGSSALSSKSNG